MGPATVNAPGDSWTVRAVRSQNNSATYTVTAICVSAL
jgi:hypothetical protein